MLATRAYIMQLQSGIHRRPAYDKSHYKEEMARQKAQEREMYPGLYRQQQISSPYEGPSTSSYQQPTASTSATSLWEHQVRHS